jgi:DNA-binding NtrC family response regulator
MSSWNESTTPELHPEEEPHHCPALTLIVKNCPTHLVEAREAFESAYIGLSLRCCAGNVARTARVLGISRRSLTRKIQELHIDLESIRSADLAMLESETPITMNLTTPSLETADS